MDPEQKGHAGMGRAGTADGKLWRWLALGIAGLLLLGACSKTDAGGSDEADGSTVLHVAITNTGCEPTELEAPAGPITFEVTNEGATAGMAEVEVFQNEQMLSEVENVVPGLTGTFSLRLEPGTYIVSCPGGENPSPGTLTVTGEAGAPNEQQSEMAKRAVATYRAYLEDQAALLVERTTDFVDAVKAGDQEEARSLFSWAREPYERIEPVAESFGDLDPRIDAREGDVPDAEWGGFHRIEKALWIDEDLEGMDEVADALLADVKELHGLVLEVKLQPAQIANGAGALLGEVSTSKITGEEDRYSHTDLWDFQANVQGAQVAFDAVAPIVAEDHPELVDEIQADFISTMEALDPFRKGDGFILYTDLTKTETRDLAQVINTLAEPISRVPAIVAQGI
jgi:iron uptake system component EfeO